MSHGIKHKKTKASWQEIAKEAQEYRDASIGRIQPIITGLPSFLPKTVLSIPATVLSPLEIEITEMPPEDLVRKLADGHVTAKTATMSFLRRAAVAQKLVRRADYIWKFKTKTLNFIVIRLTASLNYYLSKLFPELNFSTNSILIKRDQ